MNLTKSPYITGPDILYCNNSCVTRPVQLDFGEADMLPAGTPINPEAGDSGGNDNIIFVNLTRIEGYTPKRYACDMKEVDVWSAVRAGKIV